MAGLILMGDCREQLKHVPLGTVAMVLTDPPFGVSNQGNVSGASLDYSGYTSDKGEWDVEVPAQEWVPLAIKTLHPGGIFASFGTFGSLVPVFLELKRLDMRFQSHITWHKTNPAPSIHRRMLTHSNEIILVFSKGSNWVFNYDYSKSLTGKQMHNHFVDPPDLTFDVPAVRKQFGVTRKPVNLCEKLIRLFTREGDIILDPFAGSGAILEAAIRSGRQAIAIEKRLDLENYLKQTIQTEGV
jgi:site-specific DNA-methyltransferase (adenine-specific)